MPIDPNTVVSTQVTAAGVTPITMGNVASLRLRTLAAETLEQFMPHAHDMYQRIKYPGGPGSATVETRKKAYRFVFDQLARFCEVHYHYFPKGAPSDGSA